MNLSHLTMNVFRDFDDVSTAGLGCLPGKCYIGITADIKPVQHVPRQAMSASYI